MKTIILDARLTSSLDWKKEITQAKILLEKEEKIFFQFEMDLSSHFFSKSSLLSFQLAIQHFLEQVFPLFSNQIEGIIGFSGLVPNKKMEDLLFHKKFFFEALFFIFQKIPEEIPTYLIFDSKDENLFESLVFVTGEHFSHFRRILKNSRLPLSSSFWYLLEEGYFTLPSCEVNSALSIPMDEKVLEANRGKIEEIIDWHQKQDFSLRLIPEEELIYEWEGLENIFFCPASLSSEGKRKLLGFSAAGGNLISLGERLGLPEEISFEKFCNQLLLQKIIKS